MDTTEGVSIAERLDKYLEPVQETQEAQEPEEGQEIEEVQELDNEVEVDATEDEIEETEGAEEEGESLDLDTFAQYLGIDTDKLDITDDGVRVKTKIDGEEGLAKFTDVIKSYQLEGHLNKQNIAVTEKQKALEAKEAEIDQQAQQRLGQLEDLSKLAYNRLLSDYNSINWSELREIDPAEFAAKQADFQRAQQEINQGLNQIQIERQNAQSKNQEKYNNYLEEEAKRLIQVIPEWKDSDKASEEKTKIATYAKESLGFKPEEIENIADHRLVNMLRKAMLFDQLQSQNPAIEKKVKKAPKLVRPGQSSSKQSRDANDINRAREAIKKTGGKRGVTDYLMRKGIV